MRGRDLGKKKQGHLEKKLPRVVEECVFAFLLFTNFQVLKIKFLGAQIFSQAIFDEPFSVTGKELKWGVCDEIFYLDESQHIWKIPSLKLTANAPEHGWLGDSFPFGFRPIFSCYVFFSRKGEHQQSPESCETVHSSLIYYL